MNDCGLSASLTAYGELGFATLPLRSGRKEPLRRNWQYRKPADLWRNVPDESNVGIRAGGPSHVAIVDADDKTIPGTADKVAAWLRDLGLHSGHYPTVQTASGVGRHFYLALSGALPGDLRLLASDFGAGEFRYGQGAYVVAPPSRIQSGGLYSLLAGDFRQLPRIDAADVLPILKNIDFAPGLRTPSIPRRTLAMLNGKHLEGYRTRSEAEQAILTGLANAGHSFDTVLELFFSHPCAGKFAELFEKSERAALGWLRHSYEEAQQRTEAHESCEHLAVQSAIEWANSIPWHGRTARIDAKVYRAHAAIALRAGSLTYAASVRTLAELAGTGREAAEHATRRLIARSLLKLVLSDTPELAVLYGLGVSKSAHFLSTSCVEVDGL
jgi:hypothetical protein